jgi:G3E family GTPase
VAQTLYADQALARDFKLGPIVAVVDAFYSQSRKISADIARAQIAAADVVVLSKMDRAADPRDTQSEVRVLNPTAKCIPATYGDVDPSGILEAKSGTDHVFSPVAAHASTIRSFALRFEQPVRRELLQHFVSTLVDLRGADLLRVKGIVPLADDKFVLVQGVRHVFDRFRPVAKGEPALVFITNGVEKGEVQALWDAMKGLS